MAGSGWGAWERDGGCARGWGVSDAEEAGGAMGGPAEKRMREAREDEARGRHGDWDGGIRERTKR